MIQKSQKVIFVHSNKFKLFIQTNDIHIIRFVIPLNLLISIVDKINPKTINHSSLGYVK